MIQLAPIPHQVAPIIPTTAPDRFVVIGLGGIGAPVAEYLCRFLMTANPTCPLWLVDGDYYEEQNRERMQFETYGNKAVAKTRELMSRMQGKVRISAQPVYVTAANLFTIVQERDCVLLCVDNHATRKLVSDHCQTLRTVALFSGGNDGVDNSHTGAFGNVQAFIRRDGCNFTNPLTAFHVEIASPTDRYPEQEGCDDLQPTLPQLLFTNLAVASAMLATIYAWLNNELTYEELYLDILSGRSVTLRRDVQGPL